MEVGQGGGEGRDMVNESIEGNGNNTGNYCRAGRAVGIQEDMAAEGAVSTV